MNSRPLLLFADRDLSWSLALRKRLSERGLRIETVSTAPELLERVRHWLPELVILGDDLDELGSGLLGGLVQERSPETRIIRALPSAGARTADEPGPAEDLLCTVTRRAPASDWIGVITRVLNDAPRGLMTPPPLVVCVDDDETYLHGLARLIRLQGYRVLSYTEPELALEELPLVKPDLVILDVLMPGWSGFEVLGELRRYYPAQIPVILLSALEDDARIAEGRRAGASCYLGKPCAPEVLLEAVRSLTSPSKFATDPRDAARAPSRGRPDWGRSSSPGAVE